MLKHRHGISPALPVTPTGPGFVDASTVEVVEMLAGVPPEKRTARFACFLCLASPDEVLLETQGKVEGRIVDEPAGTNGFGYDPVFFLPELGKTVAQLPDAEKNTISHRGNAIAQLRPLLNQLLTS